MRPVRTLTGSTQASTIKFTLAGSESMKQLHETTTRLQIGMNVHMKHAGSFYFSFVVCFIMIRIQLKAKKRANLYSVSSPHKHHSSFKRKGSQKQEEMVDCSLSLMLPVLQSNPQPSHP